jgi:hypothetical protein
MGCAPNLKSFMREPQIIHAYKHSGLAHEACDCTTEAMPILIKPLLFLLAFGHVAILFAVIVGLAGWLLTMCVRAIARLRPSNSADVPRLHLRPSPVINKSLQHQR